MRNAGSFYLLGPLVLLSVSACMDYPSEVKTNPATAVEQKRADFDGRINENSDRLREEGREIFRYDTFGSEDFWGGKLRLHEAIAGEKQGGVGPGLTPKQALELGLKVDIGKLPEDPGRGHQGRQGRASRTRRRRSSCCRRTRSSASRASSTTPTSWSARRHHLRALPLDGR